MQISPPLLPQVSTEVPAAPFPEDEFSVAEGAGSDHGEASDEEPWLPPSCSSTTSGAGPAGVASRLAGFGGIYELADIGPL